MNSWFRNRRFETHLTQEKEAKPNKYSLAAPRSQEHFHLQRRSLIASIITIFVAPGVVLAASSSVEKELNNVRQFYQKHAPQLKSAQQLLKAYGTYTGTPSGKWNKATESAFRNALKNYIAIGGRGIDWGVNNPSDTPRFIQWLGAAVSANASGTDYPD